METKEIKRNPAYQFVSTDTNGIISDLIEGYELIMKSTVRPASPEMQLIRWIAHIIIQERMLNNWTGNQNIPSRADGANLDALAELTYIRSSKGIHLYHAILYFPAAGAGDSCSRRYPCHGCQQHHDLDNDGRSLYPCRW